MLEQTLSLSVIFEAIDKKINKLRKVAKESETLELKLRALEDVRRMEKERSNLRANGFVLEDLISGRN